MHVSTSRLWVRSRRILSAMNLNALRIQYLVISYFVLRSFLNFPARMLKTWSISSFPWEKTALCSRRVYSSSLLFSTKNSMISLDETLITGWAGAGRWALPAKVASVLEYFVPSPVGILGVAQWGGDDPMILAFHSPHFFHPDLACIGWRDVELVGWGHLCVLQSFRAAAILGLTPD